MDGTPSVSMRAILLLTILMTSGDFDKQKQEQFEKERPLFQRNHQKRFAAVRHFRGFSQPPERQNVNTTANSQTTQQYFGNRSSTYQPKIGRKSHAQDIRYYCGAVGHWSLNCPEKTERMTTSAK